MKVICNNCGEEMYLYGNCQKDEIESVYDDNNEVVSIFKCKCGNETIIE